MRKKEYVDCIASGYEWLCPKCHSLNRMVAIPRSVKFDDPKVKCQDCGKVYRIQSANVCHAYD